MHQHVKKLFLYGPQGGGKSTNLEFYEKQFVDANRSSELGRDPRYDVHLLQQNGSEEFHSLDLSIGEIAGNMTTLKVYEIPLFELEEILVKVRPDAIYFIADSQKKNKSENILAFEKLTGCLRNADVVPVFFQYNKRDMDDIMDVEELDQIFNLQIAAGKRREAIAAEGIGVIPLLQDVMHLWRPPFGKK